MALRLTKVGYTDCAGKSCPTVYATDRGTYIIQGNLVTEDSGLEIPSHEGIVEVPVDLLKSIAQA